MDIIAIIIATMSSIVALVSIIISLRLFGVIKNLREDLSTDIADVHQENGGVRKKVDEVLSGDIGLMRKIEEMQNAIVCLSENQENLKLQDPNGRMYSRARKMISLGADLEEVVRECEIPKSEAELLFSVQGKSVDTAEATESPVSKTTLGSVKKGELKNSVNEKVSSETKLKESSSLSNSLPKEAASLMEHFNKLKKQ
jgi:hypothetical protein